MQDLIPSKPVIDKLSLVVIASLLAFVSGFVWLIPFILLAAFLPGAARFVYFAFLFIVVGTTFTAIAFLGAFSMSWLDLSTTSWWITARFTLIPTIAYSLYLSKDAETFST